MDNHGFLGRENEREPDVFEQKKGWINYYEYVFDYDDIDISKDSHVSTMDLHDY